MRLHIAQLGQTSYIKPTVCSLFDSRISRMPGVRKRSAAVLQFLKKMSVSAGTTRIVAMEGNLNSSSFDMDLRDPNNLNNHLQVF